jgi:poly-beta-hydroxyalkanoate depolymerase
VSSFEKKAFESIGGHLAVFNGAQVLEEVYPEIFAQQP